MWKIEAKLLEDKRFNSWLTTLGYLSGFSLFTEFMKDDTLSHLLHEVNRLMYEDIALPMPVQAAYSIHYAESWRDKNIRKTDMILRITRIIVKVNNNTL